MSARVRAVSAGTLYNAKEPASDWPDYKNGWTATDTLLGNAGFSQLLLPIPATTSDLEILVAGFNKSSNTSYTLGQLDPDGLNLGDASPQIIDDTGGRCRC